MHIDNIEVKREALILAEQILIDLEMSRLPLSSIVLRASRLARLFGDTEIKKVFDYEASGYPYSKNKKDGGVPKEIWPYIELAKRTYIDTDGITRASCASILKRENDLESYKIALQNASDPNISTQSQFLPSGNSKERDGYVNSIGDANIFLSQRRTFIYQYIEQKYTELKFNNLTTSIWSSYKDRTDALIAELVPEETNKLSAIYENLNDTNPEKWSEALMSCRRLLKGIADKLYPASEKKVERNGKQIDVKDDNVINRLICFIEDAQQSKGTANIISSSLEDQGKRLDAIFDKVQKGVHATVSKEEAEKCFIHIYFLIGDILELARINK